MSTEPTLNAVIHLTDTEQCVSQVRFYLAALFIARDG